MIGETEPHHEEERSLDVSSAAPSPAFPPHSSPPPPPRQSLTIPTAASMLIAVQLVAEVAFYGTACTLMTYCTDMLSVGNASCNVVVNVLHTIGPLSALAASGVADGALGRRNALLLFLAIYVVGVSVIALSTFPFMYDSFPTDPGSAAKALFMIGIGIFGVGQGGMKVTITPLTADAAVCEIPIPSPPRSSRRRATAGATATGSKPQQPANHEYNAIDRSDAVHEVEEDVVDGGRRGDEVDVEQQQRAKLVSHVFHVIYWVINAGSLIGFIGAPLLRSVVVVVGPVDGRHTLPKGSGGDSGGGTSYYIGFSACAAAALCSIILFGFWFRRFVVRNTYPTSTTITTTEPRGEGSRLRIVSSSIQCAGEGTSADDHDKGDDGEEEEQGAAPHYHHHHNRKEDENGETISSPAFHHATTNPPTKRTNNFLMLRVVAKALRNWWWVTLFFFIRNHDVEEEEEKEPLQQQQQQQRLAALRLLRSQYHGMDWLMMHATISVENDVDDRNDDDAPHRTLAATACKLLCGCCCCCCSHNSSSTVNVTSALEVSQTLGVCRTFATLPLYWLISNQFSTNIVEQAKHMQRPAFVPPEALNNVNTVALLVTILICDKWLFPWLYGQSRPPMVGRMVLGFLMVAVSMLWCGVLQLIMDDRGTYQGSSETYTLYEGESLLSAMWLIGPYALQGIASVFVDCTVLESAYLLAPRTMKSSVMALYLLASSGSGFLGLALSPLAEPRYIGLMFFVLALAMALVTVLFVYAQGGWSSEGERSAARAAKPVGEEGGKDSYDRATVPLLATASSSSSSSPRKDE